MNAKVDITGVEIKTDRLLLREWRESDLNDFFEYASVDGVGQMAGWKPHADKETTKRVLGSFVSEKKVFCLEYNGKAIGSLGIEPYDEKSYPELADLKGREIGYVLLKEYWGRGLTPEAVKAVDKYCFEKIGCDFLLCGHFEWNRQSARVQEKCGYKFLKRLDRSTLVGTIEPSVMNILYKKEINNE